MFWAAVTAGEIILILILIVFLTKFSVTYLFCGIEKNRSVT